MEGLKRTHLRKRLSTFAALTLMSTLLVLGQGTPINPPDNEFSPAQDVEIGQEGAAQVRRELPLFPENSNVDNYVERVGARLVSAIPPQFHHAAFQYQFGVVNASDINAFALPGGPMFVNRGMIEASKTEGEMAGVMAHEISHVALRHGTAQASRSQNPLIQLGALGGAILGAVVGGAAGDLLAQGTHLGLGAYLLKYSREYETQADILGAQILARAGYDPMDLARMFQTIEQQGGSRGPEWFSSHPNPGNRQSRIAEEARKLSASPRDSNTAEFRNIQGQLKGLPPAASMEEAIREAGGDGGSGRENTRIEADIEPPATRYRTAEVTHVLRVSVPENWRDFPGQSSITFAPPGAYGMYEQESALTHGAIVGIVNTGAQNLRQATDQYINQLIQGNPYLRTSGGFQQTRLDGRQALSRSLRGTAPVTGRPEVVTVYTTLMNNSALLYIIHVVPESDASRYSRAFNEMVRSMRFLG